MSKLWNAEPSVLIWEELMEHVRARFASCLAALLLLLTYGASSATTCLTLPPIKPVHQICGVVYFPNGDRISKAKITVLQGRKDIAELGSDDHGKFSFDQLKAGRYELRAHFESLGIAATEILLVHPATKTKQEIAVNLTLGGRSGFSLVNAKKFEARLNPHSSPGN